MRYQRLYLTERVRSRTKGDRTMAILIINRSESRCSECPRSSVQWEGVTAHTESLGGWSGNPVPPCGEPYTAVSSDYAGMEDRIREMRPDLPWQPMGAAATA